MNRSPITNLRRLLTRRSTRRTSYALALLGVAVAIFAWVPLTPAADDDYEPQVREFTLVASEIDWEFQPGTVVKAWAYNNTLPGPELRVKEGDTVRITLVNNLPVPTTTHWHGMNVRPEMDGPAGLNQAPVEPGHEFVYEFKATETGTRWYHSHTDVATQVMLGLYGSLIVEPKDGEIEQTDRDYTYVLSEWDLELTPDVATGKAPRGPRDSQLRGGELGTDIFLMNGKTHEAIPPIVVAEGDSVRIRLINAGTVAHPFHTHGHSFRIVATDGNPVPREAQLTKDTVWIAPGERYDIVFEANNPGVWMAHCHIENHAANGMMTVIQYEGVLPSGPLAEIWNLTLETTNPDEAAAASDAYASMHAGHQMPAAATPAAETDPVAASETTATKADQPVEPAQTSDAAQAPVESDGGVVAGANEVVIAMNDDRFGPTKVEITPGTTVTWVNQGANIHSVASLDGSFSSVSVMPGESFSYTYETPGEYAFICKHHARQGMTGKVVVTA
jgi:plastocyanin